MIDLETVAMIISMVAMVMMVLSFQVKRRHTLLFMQIITSGLFAVVLFMSGGGLGAVINLLFMGRNIVFSILGERRGKPFYITFAVMSVLYLSSYFVFYVILYPTATLSEKLWDILPIVGAFLNTIVCSMVKLNALRKMKLVDSACWLIYNIHIGLGNLGGILCEIFNIVSVLIALYRFRDRSKGVAEDNDRTRPHTV